MGDNVSADPRRQCRIGQLQSFVQEIMVYLAEVRAGAAVEFADQVAIRIGS
jgi:hypothetical protein